MQFKRLECCQVVLRAGYQGGTPFTASAVVGITTCLPALQSFPLAAPRRFACCSQLLTVYSREVARSKRITLSRYPALLE